MSPRPRLALVVAAALAAGVGCDAAGARRPVVAVGGAAVRVPALRVACTDAEGSVYRTPDGLPEWSAAERGKVVRCARQGVMSAADVALRAGQKGYVGPALTSGATVLRVAYRTERLAGQAGAATALVYVPTAPRSWPVPWVVVAHGTIGLADVCAPSRKNGAFSDEMAMPLVGMGYAVIATDYAGLGNGRGRTYQGWGLAEDQAHSVLDAARALPALLEAGGLTGGVVLVGHSQGGGAVLAAQAAARSYGAGLDVRGVIGFAPGWYDARIFGRVLRHGEARTRGRLELLNAFTAMWLFAHWAVYDGAEQATVPFAAALRADVRRAMDERCILTLGARLAQLAPTVGRLYDPAFVASVLGCLDGGDCVGPGVDWLARVEADHPALDPDGARVLLLQGGLDGIVTPEATRCTVDELRARGVKVDACLDATADHFSVLGRGAVLAARFIDGAAFGAVECESKLPACVSIKDPLAP